MDAKDIAEELYRSFKSQVLWKEVDFKRISKFEKIIKKRFTLVLKETIDKYENTRVNPTVSNTLIPTQKLDTPSTIIDLIDIEPEVKSLDDVVNEIVDGADRDQDDLIVIEPQSLLQRIVMDQDNQLIQDILDEKTQENIDKNIEVKDKVQMFNDSINDSIDKRYKVQITCHSIIKKPNFQIFKGTDILETDFRTDAIVRHDKVYNAYIDTNDRANLFTELANYFVNPQLKISEVDINEIPIEYASIWQNRTKL